MPVAYRGVRPGNFKDAISIVAIGPYRDGHIEAEKLLVKCPSKYQGAEVEKSYASAPKPAAARSQLRCTSGPACSLSGERLFAGLASTYFYFRRGSRTRRDLLPAGAQPLRGLRDVPSSPPAGDPDGPPAPAPLRCLVRQLLLEPRAAAPLPDLDVLGGPGGLVPALVLLGSDHRALRLAQRPGAGSPRHDRLSLDLPRDRGDPLQAESLQAASTARPRGRRRTESAAPGPVDGHPPARDVLGLRVSCPCPSPSRSRLSGRSAGTAGSCAPSPGRSSPS